MTNALSKFESIVRSVGANSDPSFNEGKQNHPFDERNIHPSIVRISRKLFDDGHYSQATFEAFKFVDIEVSKLSKVQDSGYKLMMTAFSETNPKIKLNQLTTMSEKDEQMGYKFIFAGAMSAIRNPRGHSINVDPIGRCLDHLSLASVLLRRLEDTA